MAKKKGKKGQNKLPRAVQAQQNAQKNASQGQAGGGQKKKKKGGKNNANHQKKNSQTFPAGGVVNSQQAPAKPATHTNAQAQGQRPQQQQQQAPAAHQQQPASQQRSGAAPSSIGHFNGQWQQPPPQQQARQQQQPQAVPQRVAPQQPQPGRGGASGQWQQPRGALVQPQQGGQARFQQPQTGHQPAPTPNQMRGGPPGIQRPQQGPPPGMQQRAPPPGMQQRGPPPGMQQRGPPGMQQGGQTVQRQGQFVPQQQGQRAPQQQGQRAPQQQRQAQYAASPQLQQRGPPQQRGAPQMRQQPQAQTQYGGQPAHFHQRQPVQQQQQPVASGGYGGQPSHFHQTPQQLQQQQQVATQYQQQRPPPLTNTGGQHVGGPDLMSPSGVCRPSPPLSSRASSVSARSSLSGPSGLTTPESLEQLNTMMANVQIDDDTRSQASSTRSSTSSKIVARAREKGSHIAYAPNPAPSTIGRPLKVISNMYRTSITVQVMAAYDVKCYDASGQEIEDTLRPYRKSLYFALKEQITAAIGITFFDNTSLRAFHGKERDRLQFDNLSDPKARHPLGRIEMKCTGVVNLNDAATSYDIRHQYIHIMLKSLASDAGLVRLGRSWLQHHIFSNTNRPTLVPYDSISGPDNLEVHRGFQLSIENVVRSLFMLKTDIVHHLVSQQRCDDIYNSAFVQAGQRFPRDNARAQKEYERMVEEELVRSIVLTRYNPRLRYRVKRIAWEKTPDSTFVNDRGEEQSYRDYTSRRWKYDSDFAFNGLICSTQKFRNKDGIKEEKEIFLLPDACHRTGLTGKMKDNFHLKKAVSQATTVSPYQRTGITDRVVRDLNRAGAQEAKETPVPLKFVARPENVRAKILNPPMLRVQSRRGLMRVGANPKGFSHDVDQSCIVTNMTTKVSQWAMVYPGERDSYHLIGNLCERLDTAWKKFGTALGQPHFEEVDTGDRSRAMSRWKAALDNVMQRNVQMVVVVLPRNSDSFYHLTSERGSFYGVVTQCVKYQQMRGKRFGQVINGMVRQMKAKNCANPWQVEMPLVGHPKMLAPGIKLNTMLVGMDVNHDRKNDTSTVGFCSTYGDALNYFSQHRFQQFQKESITDSKGLMMEALLFFKQKTGALPKNVVIFRDGVSDSQFEMVMNCELRGYRSAARDAGQREHDPGYKPKFTVIITQKRVSIRFTTSDKKSVPPGTVVDTDVISDGVWNFYLHPVAANLQGHVVPTRFVVLQDEVGFTQNDMQTMCHNLCYAYPNWAGPIRVPSPAMMAHGVAFKFASGRAASIDRRNGGVIQKITGDNPKLAGKNHCL